MSDVKKARSRAECKVQSVICSGNSLQVHVTCHKSVGKMNYIDTKLPLEPRPTPGYKRRSYVEHASSRLPRIPTIRREASKRFLTIRTLLMYQGRERLTQVPNPFSSLDSGLWQQSLRNYPVDARDLWRGRDLSRIPCSLSMKL